MTRRPFTTKDRNLVQAMAGQVAVNQIAAMLGRNPKVIYNYLERNGKKLRPRYNDMEHYMLEEFSVSNASQFINRSANALRIKKHRIRCKLPLKIS